MNFYSNFNFGGKVVDPRLHQKSIKIGGLDDTVAGINVSNKSIQVPDKNDFESDDIDSEINDKCKSFIDL